jgi:cytochrome c oxidase subunit IV
MGSFLFPSKNFRRDLHHGTRSSIDVHYHVIGGVLLECEHLSYHALPLFFEGKSSGNISLHFQERSVLVPTPFLEEYLDDLLDLSREDSALCISMPISLFLSQVALLTVLSLIAGSLALITEAYQLREWSYVILASCAIFVAMFVQLQWRRRRFFFARIVVSEINRRRGNTLLCIQEEVIKAPQFGYYGESATTAMSYLIQ